MVWIDFLAETFKHNLILFKGKAVLVLGNVAKNLGLIKGNTLFMLYFPKENKALCNDSRFFLVFTVLILLIPFTLNNLNHINQGGGDRIKRVEGFGKWSYSYSNHFGSLTKTKVLIIVVAQLIDVIIKTC